MVIILGTLAAVAVPKFSRVLETRRTGEAEEMLETVRMEQEKRCSLGQNYAGDFSNIPTLAYVKSGESRGKTNNYTYTLTSTGVEASRGDKNYVLKIPSYKQGKICCEGSGCDALNKSYLSCSSLSLPAEDECAATDVVVTEPEDPCEAYPNTCACSSYASSHRCECDSAYASANACECNPSTSTCCEEGEEWNPQTGSCEAYEQSCTENPNQAKCCTGCQIWNGSSCVMKTCGEGETLNANTCECEGSCQVEISPWYDGGPSQDTCNGDSVNETTSCPAGKKDGYCYDVASKPDNRTYEYLGSLQSLPRDTCDGDVMAKYTCPSEKKSCVDIVANGAEFALVSYNNTSYLTQAAAESAIRAAGLTVCPSSCAALAATGLNKCGSVYTQQGYYLYKIQQCYYQNVQKASVSCNQTHFRQIWCCGKN